MNLFELTKTLIDIPSISDDEQVVGFFLRDYLESLGWTVELQAVSGNQNNVIAYLNQTPRVFFLNSYGHCASVYRLPVKMMRKSTGAARATLKESSLRRFLRRKNCADRESKTSDFFTRLTKNREAQALARRIFTRLRRNANI
jgi:hypothetical protein